MTSKLDYPRKAAALFRPSEGITEPAKPITPKRDGYKLGQAAYMREYRARKKAAK